MAKKLIIVWLSITIITCSSISIYATTQTKEEDTVDKSSITTSELTAEVASRTSEKITAITAEAKAQAEAQAEEERKQAEQQNIISGITNYIMSINRNVGASAAGQMAQYFVNAANNYNVDVYYLVAIAKHESTFYTNVTSSANCRGLMQTSDTLAAKYGYSPSDAYTAEASINIGAQYLRACLDTFGGNYTLALSGYAYGCGAVKSGNYNTGYANSFTAIRSSVMSYI